LKIKDFINGRDVSYATVRKYIVNHPETFKGHVGRANNIILDEFAISVLDKKYPLMDLVKVIHDPELQEEVRQLHKKYEAVLEENKHLVQENANLMLAHHKNLLLEEELKSQQKELQELRSLKKEQRSWVKEFNSQSREIAGLENLLAKERQEQRNREAQLQQVQQELEKEKNKTWWDKLRGR